MRRPRRCLDVCSMCKTQLWKWRAYTQQEGLQDGWPVGCQWSQRQVVAPMVLLLLIMVHNFFMVAAPSVLPNTSGVPAKHRFVRKTEGEEAWCSSPAESWRPMAPPHQSDLSVTLPSLPPLPPPHPAPWQVGICIAGRGSRGGSALQSSLRWQVHIHFLPVSGRDSRHVTELWKMGHIVS